MFLLQLNTQNDYKSDFSILCLHNFDYVLAAAHQHYCPAFMCVPTVVSDRLLKYNLVMVFQGNSQLHTKTEIFAIRRY